VRQAQGDLAAALISYQASLDILERLAKADPGNAGWRRDLSASHIKIGDVQQAQGDQLPARPQRWHSMRATSKGNASRATASRSAFAIALTPAQRPGFFDFTHCRLRPLQYRLPARFDTIPSRPSSQALANTSAPSAAKASLNRMLSTPATSGESAARRSSSGR